MSIRDLESASIRAFLEDNAHLLGGRVLDYGCGKQPYRDLIEAAGGEYNPHDRAGYPASTVSVDTGVTGPFFRPRIPQWDAVVCTQVIQYVPEVRDWLRLIWYGLNAYGFLLMTGPTAWPVLGKEDLWRFTVPAVELLLEDAGFSEIEVAYRASVRFENEDWPLGWWAKCRA